MKKHILSVIMAVAVIILASCSKNDPTPTNTTKTPIYFGTWKFDSARVTPVSGAAYDQIGYTACNSTASPAFKVDFQLTTTTDATQLSSCFASAPLKYVGTVSNGKLIAIDFTDTGSKAYSFTNIVIDETKKTITANQVFPIDLSKQKSIVVHFHIK